MNLFELFVKIGVDDQASKNIQNLSTKLGNGLKKAADIGIKAVGAMSAATVAFTGALTKGITSTAQYGDTIDKMSQKMGLSAKAYQEWDFIMQHSGTSMESLKAGMKTLANAVDTNNEAFKRLGISQKDIASMNQEELFAKTIEQLQKVDDETERTYLAGQLLGRGATELGALLNMSAEETEAMRKQVHELGGVMSDEAVKASAGFQDSLQNAKTALSGVKNNLMSDFLPSLSLAMDGLAKIFSGNESGLSELNEGVETFTEKLSDFAPKVIEIFGNIFGSIGLAITKSLPKLAKTAVEMVKSFAKSFKKNAKIIINAAKDLVLTFIDGMVDMLPDIIDAAVELLGGIVGAIPDVAANIIKNIPKIISAIVEGLGKGVATVGRAIKNLFSSVDEELDVVSAKLSASADAVTPFIDAVNEAATKTADLSSALSENGKTISDLDDEIEKAEQNITDILKKAFKGQNGLREEDLENIRKYQRELQKLNEEKLGIYQNQQLAELRKAQSSVNELIAEDAQEASGRAQSALSESNKMVEEIYSNRITTIENYHKAQGTLNSSAYKKDLADAKKWANDAKKINQGYYNDTIKLVNESSDKWIEADNKTWKQVNAITEKVRQASERLRYVGWDWADDLNADFYDTIGIWDEQAVNFGNALAKIDEDATNAFLSMQATVVASGGVLDEESKKSVENILSAFEGLPPTMDEQGRKILDSLIIGLEDKIPELKKSGEMTTDEILGVLRKNLLGKNGSMEKIGKDAAAGLKKGILSEYQNIVNASVKISNAVLSTMIKTFDIHSPSRVLRDKIGKQIVAGLALGITDYAYLAEDAADNLSRDVSDSFEDMDIITTSSSSIGDFTSSNNKSDNYSNKTEFSLTIDDSNAMGLARALLPLLKIAEKEVYA